MVNNPISTALTLAKNAGIDALNPLQEMVLEASKTHSDLLILAATGSGKTLAYLLPAVLNHEPQSCTLIIAPTRELVLQIEQVFRSLQTGLHTVVCYGGHALQTETNRLSQQPQFIIGTPGRLNDHLEKGNLPIFDIQSLVIDEYDKCLEMGFDEQIHSLCDPLKNLKRKILVSATKLAALPRFLNSSSFSTVQGAMDVQGDIEQIGISSTASDRLKDLHTVLLEQQGKSTMVFCNLRETTILIHDFLEQHGYETTVYHGGMEQQDRERAYIQFSNGTFHTLICTDIGSRGLDIDDVETVIHFETPRDEATVVHRNGRTARMGKNGKVYFFLDEKSTEQNWFPTNEIKRWKRPTTVDSYRTPQLVTIYFSGGKKDKLRKVDLVGALIQLGGLRKEEIGQLHVMDRTSFAAVPRKKYKEVLNRLKDQKIKGKKFRVARAKPANVHTT